MEERWLRSVFELADETGDYMATVPAGAGVTDVVVVGQPPRRVEARGGRRAVGCSRPERGRGRAGALKGVAPG